MKNPGYVILPPQETSLNGTADHKAAQVAWVCKFKGKFGGFCTQGADPLLFEIAIT